MYNTFNFVQDLTKLVFSRCDDKTMHLLPHEIDKLYIYQVGTLAQKRLARGLLLNYSEAAALISFQVLVLLTLNLKLKDPGIHQRRQLLCLSTYGHGIPNAGSTPRFGRCP